MFASRAARDMLPPARAERRDRYSRSNSAINRSFAAWYGSSMIALDIVLRAGDEFPSSYAGMSCGWMGCPGSASTATCSMTFCHRARGRARGAGAAHPAAGHPRVRGRKLVAGAQHDVERDHGRAVPRGEGPVCLLYTSDAADE